MMHGLLKVHVVGEQLPYYNRVLHNTLRRCRRLMHPIRKLMQTRPTPDPRANFRKATSDRITSDNSFVPRVHDLTQLLQTVPKAPSMYTWSKPTLEATPGASSRPRRCRTRTNNLMRNRTASNEEHTHVHTTRNEAVRAKDATGGAGESDAILATKTDRAFKET